MTKPKSRHTMTVLMLKMYVRILAIVLIFSLVVDANPAVIAPIILSSRFAVRREVTSSGFVAQALAPVLAEFEAHTFSAAFAISLAETAAAQTLVHQPTEQPSRFKSTVLLPVDFKVYEEPKAGQNNRLLPPEETLEYLKIVIADLAGGLKPFLSAFQNDAITPALVTEFRKLQRRSAEQLLATPGTRMEFESIFGRPIATDPVQQWEEMLFEVLPYYFGRHGLYFHVGYEQLTKNLATSLAHYELAVSIGLYPVRAVNKTVEIPDWNGQTVSWQEIDVDTPVMLNGAPIQTGVFHTSALTDCGTIVRNIYDHLMNVNAMSGYLAQYRDNISQFENEEWEEVIGTIDPLDFSQFKIMLRQHRESIAPDRLLEEESQVSQAHELGHFRNAQANLLPMRLPWAKNWTDYQQRFLWPMVASELEGMMREHRFASREFFDISAVDLLVSWRRPEEGYIYQLARFNLIYRFLNELVANQKAYGSIRWRERRAKTPREHAGGQIYRLTYEEWQSAWDAAHLEWVQAGRPLFIPRTLNQDTLYRGETSLPPIVIGAGGLMALSTTMIAGALGVSWARRAARKRAELAYLRSEVGTKAATLYRFLNNRKKFNKVLGQHPKTYEMLRKGAKHAGDEVMGGRQMSRALTMVAWVVAGSFFVSAAILLSYEIRLNFPLSPLDLWQWATDHRYLVAAIGTPVVLWMVYILWRRQPPGGGNLTSSTGKNKPTLPSVVSTPSLPTKMPPGSEKRAMPSSLALRKGGA